MGAVLYKGHQVQNDVIVTITLARVVLRPSMSHDSIIISPAQAIVTRSVQNTVD